MAEEGKINVLFVCLGNICRSPLAEAVFDHLLKTRSLDDKIACDGAGTAGYHVGELPDERTTEVCRKHGVKVDSVCRQLVKEDFYRFDWIIGMDSSNMSNIQRLSSSLPSSSSSSAATKKAETRMFGDFVQGGKPIQDPYYGGSKGFEKAYQQCLEYSEGVLEELGFGKKEETGKL